MATQNTMVTQNDAEITPAKNAQPSPAMPGRRTYSKDMEVDFLKEVVAAGAHLAKRGEKGTSFAKVASNLNASGRLPWVVDEKHCFDKLRGIVKVFKQSDPPRRKTVSDSGEVNEREVLLNDIVDDMDEQDANGGAVRRRGARKEAMLKDTGAQTGDEVVVAAGRTRPGRSGATISVSDESADADMPARKRRKRASVQLDAELEECLKIERQRVRQEDEMIRIESARLVLEQKGLELEQKRLELDKAKFEAAKEERESMLAQIKINATVQAEMLAFLSNMQKDGKK